jgi:hypothetical protein
MRICGISNTIISLAVEQFCVVEKYMRFIYMKITEVEIAECYEVQDDLESRSLLKRIAVSLDEKLPMSFERSKCLRLQN